MKLLPTNLIILIIITSCSYDQASIIIKNQSDDSIRVDFYLKTEFNYIDIGFSHTSKDSIGLETLRKKFGIIRLNDSIITNNLLRNKENIQLLFKEYFVDSVNLNMNQTFIMCNKLNEFQESNGPILMFFTKNTNNFTKYKDLCEVLNCPPSKYYKNDTSIYSKLLNNIFPVYIPPGESFVVSMIHNYGSTYAEDIIGRYEKVVINRKDHTHFIINRENFKNYFNKVNAIGSRNSYLLELKNKAK